MPSTDQQDLMTVRMPYQIAAGRCTVEEVDGEIRVKPEPEPGVLEFNVVDTGFLTMRWFKRDEPPVNDNDYFVLLHQDAFFYPWLDKSVTNADGKHTQSPTDGRIYVLKFKTSDSRQLFWLQTPVPEAAELNQFTDRDLLHKEHVRLLIRMAMGS